MNGIIFDIKHFAIHDGPGIRQTIFFKGCPLNCWWCHNPESQDKNIEIFTRVNRLNGKEFKRTVNIGYQVTPDGLFKIINGDKIFFEESGGGVTFSGGEPFLQTKFLYKVLELCKENNIHSCIDTTGFTSLRNIQYVSDIVDCFLYDIKFIDNDLSKRYTGVSVDTILANLIWLDDNKKNVILRLPVIPNITNTKENISAIKAFIVSLKSIRKIDLLPYHNISNNKYQKFKKVNRMYNVEPLSENELLNLKYEFEDIGFEVGVGG